jgi:TolA-binding protein
MALLLVGALLGSVVLADESQEQRFREREVLDPETGEWVAEQETPDAAAGDALDEARGLLAIGKPRDARKLVNNWLKTIPDDARYFEALFLLGETYFWSRDFWKAGERFQTVAENAAGPLFRRANEYCVDVARAFLSGEPRIFWRIFRVPAYDDGLEILDRVWQREPGSPLGEMALKLKADYFFQNGDFDLAQDEYANLAQQYPSGRFIQLAMLRTAESAEAAFPGIKFDASPLIDADVRYRQFQDAFPTHARRENVSERIEGIRQQRAEKDLDIAGWYERTNRPDAAQFYYLEILEDWPDTLAATEARARLRALGVDVEQADQPTVQEDQP